MNDRLNNDMFGRRDNSLGRVLVIILIALALGIGALIVSVINTKAMGTVEYRSNACRTYHLFGHEKTRDMRGETDGEYCGLGTIVMLDTESTDGNADVPTAAVVVADSDVPVSDVVIVDTESSDTPTNDTPADPADNDECAKGNPGNLKCVGNAGENPNGKDTMPADNTGGNGNGQHGNQGEKPGQGKGLLNQSAMVGWIFLQVKKGKKEYDVWGVKRWNMNKNTLWVTGNNGEMGYITNAKVTWSFVSDAPFSLNFYDAELAKVIRMITD